MRLGSYFLYIYLPPPYFSFCIISFDLWCGSGRPQCIFALGISQNKDDIMADLWIDAQTAETKHKWISAIRKAMKGEPIVETRQDTKDEVARDLAELNTLKEGAQTTAVKSQIAMLSSEIEYDEALLTPNDADGVCGMCSSCTVM